jgi:DNA-binding XRE family transcriptional regulator
MVSAEFKAIRVHLGLTQEQLAEQLDVHRISVTRWETGVHKISTILEFAIRALEREHHKTKQTESESSVTFAK